MSASEMVSGTKVSVQTRTVWGSLVWTGVQSTNEGSNPLVWWKRALEFGTYIRGVQNIVFMTVAHLFITASQLFLGPAASSSSSFYSFIFNHKKLHLTSDFCCTAIQWLERHSILIFEWAVSLWLYFLLWNISVCFYIMAVWTWQIPQLIFGCARAAILTYFWRVTR